MEFKTDYTNSIKIGRIRVLLNDTLSRQTGSVGYIFGSEEDDHSPEIMIHFKNLCEIDSFINILESAKQRMLLLCNQK